MTLFSRIRSVFRAQDASAVSRRRARDAVVNVLAGLGTLRDKRSHTQWAIPVVIDPVQLDGMYRGSSLSRKIVDIPADDMTRAWTRIVFDDENPESQFKIEQAETRLSMRSKICEALTWARLYGGAVLIIGTRDSDLTKPLVIEQVRRGSLAYLHVIDRWNIAPLPGLVSDPASEYFGTPEFYQLPNGVSRIHCSRLIRFDGAKLPRQQWLNNGMWHDSVLQSVQDSLLNYDTTTQSVASMLFEANVDVIHSEGLYDLLASKEGEKKAKKRFEVGALLKSFNRMLLLDTAETYDKKSNTFSGIDAIMQQFMLDVSSAADIPVTRLFGQSAAGFNATGDNDIRNYYDMVQSRQENSLRKPLDKLYRIIAMSEFGRVPDDLRFTFNSLWQMTETERVTVEKTRAERDQIYVQNSVLPEHVATRELMERGTYASLTEEDIRAIKNFNNPIDPTPDDGGDETGGDAVQ
jgi:phage-related protein (TIGR01555 family)